ncbi:MAG: glycosyltransferase [Candidatus Omnitrophota bacterium]
MKVLIYGEAYGYALAPQIKRSFVQLGCDAEIFNWTMYLYTERGINLKNRVFNRIMLKSIAAKINRDFINVVKKNKYDLVLVNNGWHLTGDTIDAVKKYAKKVVNWSTDELFNKVFARFIHVESYSKYDCIFSQRKHLFDSYLTKGIKRVEFLPLFYYPEHHPVVVSEKDKLLWGSDIAFMGTWNKEREKIIEALTGYNVKIWGAQWNRSKPSFKKKFEITNKIAWLEDMSKVVSSTKIIVDNLTKGQTDKVNMKNYQIPACGGVLLTQRTDVIQELFEENKEVICYDSLEELREKCEYYLKNEAARNSIAVNGYKKVVSAPNTILDRIKDILQVCS